MRSHLAIGTTPMVTVRRYGTGFLLKDNTPFTGASRI